MPAYSFKSYTSAIKNAFWPITLFTIVLYFLFRWVEEDRSFYLVLAGITGTAFCLLAVLHFAKTARITRHISTVIVIVLTLCFFAVSYLFRSHIDHVMVESDLSANLERLSSYRSELNSYFLRHTEQGEFLRKRLTAEPFWRQPDILAEFLKHHSDDYFSIYLLDDQNLSLMSEPPSIGYKENYPIRNLTNPAFVEPSFQPSADSGQSSKWYALKYFIPLETAEGQKRYVLLNMRTDVCLLMIKQHMPGASVFLMHDNEIIATNEKRWNENFIRQITNDGYGRDAAEQLFYARYPLRWEHWSVVFVQTLNTAFPNMTYAESALVRVLIFSAVLGLLTGFILSWYISRNVLLPVSRLAKDFQIITAGNTIHANHNSLSNTQDEIGVLHQAVDVIVENLKEKTKQAEDVQRRLDELQSDIERQFDATQQIRNSIIRTTPLLTRGLTIRGQMVMSDEYGAKYYDITEPKPGYVVFAIVDPAGKGVRGTYYAALMKGLLGEYWKHTDLLLQDPLRWMNELESDFIKHRDTDTQTVEFAVGVINTHEHRVRLINAGSEYPILKKNNQTHTLTIRGRALGMPSWLNSFETTTFVLGESDTMYLYSKGISPDALTSLNGNQMDDSHQDTAFLQIARKKSHIESHVFTTGTRIGADIENKIEEMMSGFGFEVEKSKSMISACREILNLSTRVGGQRESKKSIHIETEIWESGVEVRITDQTEGSIRYDKSIISAMQKFADEVMLEQTNNKPTIVLRMAK